MPTLKSPFTRLASAPPPGSSYYISNASIIAKRVALSLQGPVRIRDEKGEQGDPLFDLCKRYNTPGIECMQLRKERQAPFFHEYITFRLNDGSCFRIDRRQLPDERSPMACAEDKGVEAFDTIEQIEFLEDSMYNPSEVLCQIDFPGFMHMPELMSICTEISANPSSSTYTVQKYNCYFYAQTVMLLSVHRAFEIFNCYGWIDLHRWQLSHGMRIELNTKPEQTTRAGLLQSLRGELKNRKPNPVVEPDLRRSNSRELQEYLLTMIQTHSVRVEQYKLLLRFSAKNVENDIKKAMNEIWDNLPGRSRDLRRTPIWK